MKYKCSLVKLVAGKGILLQFTTVLLQQRISDLTHSDEITKNNLLDLFGFLITSIKIIVRKMVLSQGEMAEILSGTCIFLVQVNLTHFTNDIYSISLKFKKRK